MKVLLGIETSCDDTAAAVVREDMEVLSNVVASQLEEHARYGGVVPEVASRAHASEIVPVVEAALERAGVTGPELAGIAVTRGPGLLGSLLIGVSVAKALSLAWDVPLVAVNHLHGHLASSLLGGESLEWPCLVLLVSGGHTLLARMDGPDEVEVLGGTRDDSAGEAYDKVARMLGLGYPGGPVIDRAAKRGTSTIDFPRPMLHKGLEFSFSGLKTAVGTYLRQHPDAPMEDVCSSFADAVMDVLVTKLSKALRSGSFKCVAVVGGVAASPILRERLGVLGAKHGVKVVLPPPRLATDNGAMIAAAGWGRLKAGAVDELDVRPDPGLTFG